MKDDFFKKYVWDVIKNKELNIFARIGIAWFWIFIILFIILSIIN